MRYWGIYLNLRKEVQVPASVSVLNSVTNLRAALNVIRLQMEEIPNVPNTAAFA